MRIAFMHSCVLHPVYDRTSEVCKQLTPSRQRSPILSQTGRGSRLTPAAAKICPIDRLSHANMRASIGVTG
jgi:hypothetical protein